MPRRKTMRMSRRFLSPFVLGAVVLAGAVVAAEVGLRGIDWRYERGAPQRVVWSLEHDRQLAQPDDPYEFSPTQLWRPRPNAKIPWTANERFNAEGYRGPLISVKRPEKTLRIAALGGAGTLGVGVAQEDTFVSLTARLLSTRSMRCESMNLGVESYSLRQSLERYRDIARPYRPHVVLLSISSRSSYSPAPGDKTDDELIEMCRPLGPLQPDHPPSLDNDLRVAQGLRWVRDAVSGAYWEDRDFQFRLKRLEPTARRLDWPGTRRVPMKDFDGSLSLLLQEASQDGAHVILLVLPPAETGRVPPIQALYDRVAVGFAERENLIVLDERNPYLTGLADELASTDMYGADRYPSVCAHAAIAQALSEIIVRGIAVKAAQPPPPKEPGPKPR